MAEHTAEELLKALIDELPDTDGMVFPAFGDVVVDNDPIGSALEVFEMMFDRYYIPTGLLRSVLDSPDSGVYRDWIDPEDLSIWLYYMELFELAGGSPLDPWAFVRPDSSGTERAKARSVS